MEKDTRNLILGFLLTLTLSVGASYSTSLLRQENMLTRISSIETSMEASDKLATLVVKLELELDLVSQLIARTAVDVKTNYELIHEDVETMRSLAINDAKQEEILARISSNLEDITKSNKVLAEVIKDVAVLEVKVQALGD